MVKIFKVFLTIFHHYALNRHDGQIFKLRSFFWSIFSYIWTEYGDLLRHSPYSVRIQENTDQKKLRIWTLFTSSRLEVFCKKVFLKISINSLETTCAEVCFLKSRLWPRCFPLNFAKPLGILFYKALLVAASAQYLLTYFSHLTFQIHGKDRNHKDPRRGFFEESKFALYVSTAEHKNGVLRIICF